MLLESCPLIKSDSTMTLDPESRKECESIMERIYGEEPGNWPYGLDIKGHDGGVWLVREPEHRKAAGFVGWQERMEPSGNGWKKVGYYSIGILPEYRGHGYAKAAIRQLVNIKSASVDAVRAFIVPQNNVSISLAKSLGIPVVHDA